MFELRACVRVRDSVFGTYKNNGKKINVKLTFPRPHIHSCSGHQPLYISDLGLHKVGHRSCGIEFRACMCRCGSSPAVKLVFKRIHDGVKVLVLDLESTDDGFPVLDLCQCLVAIL